jgi:hypothetical protein
MDFNLCTCKIEQRYVEIESYSVTVTFDRNMYDKKHT